MWVGLRGVTVTCGIIDVGGVVCKAVAANVAEALVLFHDDLLKVDVRKLGEYDVEAVGEECERMSHHIAVCTAVKNTTEA